MKNFAAGAGESCGGFGAFFFFGVVHINGISAQVHDGDAGRPLELRVAQDVEILAISRKIMTPGITVALWIEGGGCGFIDDGLSLPLDIVVEGIGHFAGRDAFGEIPGQSIVVGGFADGGAGGPYRRRVRAGGEFLIQQGGNLIFETEEAADVGAVVERENRTESMVTVEP